MLRFFNVLTFYLGNSLFTVTLTLIGIGSCFSNSIGSSIFIGNAFFCSMFLTSISIGSFFISTFPFFIEIGTNKVIRDIINEATAIIVVVQYWTFCLFSLLFCLISNLYCLILSSSSFFCCFISNHILFLATVSPRCWAWL